MVNVRVESVEDGFIVSTVDGYEQGIPAYMILSAFGETRQKAFENLEDGMYELGLEDLGNLNNIEDKESYARSFYE